MAALIKHPQLSQFEVEQAIFTTDIVDDLEELVTYLFNTHSYLTGKIEQPDILQVLAEIDGMAAEGVAV